MHTNKDEVNRIMKRDKWAIRKEIMKLLKRIDYLEGKEYYEGIKKDILAN